RLDHRLVRLHRALHLRDRRLLVLVALPALEPAWHQLAVALHVALCALQLRDILRRVGLRLVQRRLIWTRINQEQLVALLHLLPLLEDRRDDRAIAPALHVHGIDRLPRTDALHIDGHVLGAGDAGGNRDRRIGRWRGRTRGFAAKYQPPSQSRRDN